MTNAPRWGPLPSVATTRRPRLSTGTSSGALALGAHRPSRATSGTTTALHDEASEARTLSRGTRREPLSLRSSSTRA